MIWWLLLVIIVVINGESDNSCTLENGILGECVKVKDCPLSESGDICGFFGDAVAVCCRVSNLRNAESNDVSATLTRTDDSLRWLSRGRCIGTMIPRVLPKGISSGSQARPLTFRHMAILGYGDESSPTWGCGGSLISHKHILTAAHCLMEEKPSVVRLGDLVISRSDDMADPKDYKIKKFHIYDGYKYPARYHDIAVLELAEVVLPTEFVEVACIDIDRYHDDNFYSIMGWGKIEFSGPPSDALLEGYVNLTDTEKCRSSYGTEENEYPYGILDKYMICAGGKSDTCHGDSGGPLVVYNSEISDQFKRDVYNIVGITSFGKPCKITPDPAIYTRVQYYLPWIERIVRASMPGASPAEKSRNSCQNEHGIYGECVKVKDCPLWDSGDICGFFGDAVAVCCRVATSRDEGSDGVNETLTRTKEIETIEWLSRDRCMQTTIPWAASQNVGRGSQARTRTHMAVLGYGNETAPRWGCTGSLISHKHILTAAHCLVSEKPSIIRLEDPVLSKTDDNFEPQDYKIKEVYIYDGYKYPAVYHDIAILELDRIVLPTKYTQIACLDTNMYHNDTFYFSMSWGKTEFAGPDRDALLKTNVTLTDIQKCRLTYGTDENMYPDGILDKYMMCAGGKSDTCDEKRDSGGPLVIVSTFHDIGFDIDEYTIVGITSFGKSCTLTPNPGVYTRVHYYLPWIEWIIQKQIMIKPITPVFPVSAKSIIPEMYV